MDAVFAKVPAYEVERTLRNSSRGGKETVWMHLARHSLALILINRYIVSR